MPEKFRLLIILSVLVCVSALMPKETHALSLSNASASATTSRPSPSSPLSTAYSSGVSTVTVIDNTSTFLASDAAKFFVNGTPDPVTIATTSADKLTLNFTGTTASAHNATGVIAVPITAMHTVVFTTQTSIPASGQFEIAYPTSVAADTNQASPSAATWMLNNLSNSTDIQSTQGSNCTWAISGTSAGSVPKATCTATAGIPSGSTIWVWLGCTAASGTSCTTQRPLIINPTHSPSTNRGTADVKNVIITTYQSSGGSVLDTGTVKIGTIESIFVVAHIDPTFSFNIDGVAASTDMHTSGTCSTSYANISTNSSFPSTGTEVNLGTITSGGNTYAAQKMTLRSNTGSGYVITATTSGFLLYPAIGSYVVNAQGNVTANNTPAPTTISSTTGGYGINACDANSRVSTSIWGQASPNFANPSAQFYYTLVNYSGAPSSSGDVIYAVYGARAGGSTPPGDYWQIITYTASVTF
ncbi:MAG: hypothetical protein AAB478_03710 [Patescibacteria group bacterium]